MSLEMTDLIDQKKELTKSINASLEWKEKCLTLKALHECTEWKEYQSAFQTLKDMEAYVNRTLLIRQIKDLKETESNIA